MEKLRLVFEFSIFVNSHCGVRRLRSYILEGGINANSLHKFAMTFKCLYLGKLVWGDTPQDACAVQRAGHKVLGGARPCQIYYITNMTSQLAWMSPLNSLL